MRLGAASNFLRSFSSRDFRFLWFADTSTGWGEQMEFLVLSWFVFTSTESPFLLSLFAALRFTGTMFAPYYGILVDRYDRKTLLVIVRSGFAMLAVGVLILGITGQLAVWHVLVFVALGGMGRAFDNVTRQSIIPDVVDRSRLANAVALTRTARDIPQMGGPIVAGLVSSHFGFTASYLLIVGVYVFATLVTTRMHTPTRTPTARGTSVIANFVETAKYIRKEEVILALLLMAFLVNFAGYTFNLGMITVFAHDILGTDESGLGFLLGAYAFGAFFGSIIIAGIPRFGRPGRFVFIGSIGWHGMILIISQMQWFEVTVPMLALAGFSQSFTMVTMAMLLLGETSSNIRGRVMGIRSLAVYGLPLGLLAFGGIAERYGASITLVINGVIGIFFTLVIAVWIRPLWNIRQRG